jgi:hypothetical protein
MLLTPSQISAYKLVLSTRSKLPLGFFSRGDFARAPEGIELFPLWIKEMVDPSLEMRVGYHSLLEEPCFRSREFPGFRAAPSLSLL